MGMSREKREDILWDLHGDITEEIVPIELSGEIAPDLFGIEPVKAKEMVSGLSIVFAEREVLKNAYIDVIELPVSKENLPVFKELRLKIVKNRTQGIEKWHKTNKAFYLAGGRFVDAIKNKEVLENEAMESKLMEAENFFLNQEKEKARLLNLERIEKVRPYVEDVTGLDFSEFDDENFDDYVLGKKTRFENEAKAKKEAEELAEKERLAEIERQRLIEVENANLRKEAEEKEALLQKERAETARIAKLEADKQAKIQADKDAEIKKEREAKEKLEAEIKAKKDAEEKAEAVRIAEAVKLAKAPVKEQLKKWIESFELPKTDLYNDTELEIKEKFEAFKKWSLSQVNNL